MTRTRDETLAWIDPAWNWPSEITELLERVCAACRRPEVHSAVLTGSTARGELAIERTAEGIELRSDVELYVVASDPARARLALEPDLRAIEAEVAGAWPAFHIDVACMTLQRFERLEPWIRNFELRANGKTVAGIDCLERAPVVGLDSLDWQELNEVALWRMLGTVARLPCAWLRGERALGLEERHALARCLLDATTWACPGFGVLLPSFRARVEWWSEPGSIPDPEARALPSAELLGACFAARSDSGALPDGEELFASVAATWDAIHRIVSGETPSAHRGAGRGFRRVDGLRRARAAWRVLPRHREHTLGTLTEGPFRVAARRAHALLLEARALRDTPVATGIRSWNALRAGLAAYMDDALGRREWSRHLPAEDCTQ